MVLTEFQLIDSIARRQNVQRADVVHGIGDDAAVLRVPDGCDVVMTVDTLIEGVHFPMQTCAYDVGFKSLAVSLSDLAAMGANPAWATLALTLPSIDCRWIEEFISGLFDLAEKFDVQLVGGDTTRGSLSISLQACGYVAKGCYLSRTGAGVGDAVVVSGILGGAALALECLRKPWPLAPATRAACAERLNRPVPRVNLGQRLVGVASSAIDISDGLAADLEHVLRAAGVGAIIDSELLPLMNVPPEVISCTELEQYALSGGDDYELCFTVPANKLDRIASIALETRTPCTRIGTVTAAKGLHLRKAGGAKIPLAAAGYRHF